MLTDKARAETPEERLVPLKKKAREDTLLVHEIYASVQGESTWAGVPCVFVRTTGCHLRCSYCDTEHAFHAGTERELDDVIAEVARHAIPLVELTGGEPLLQRSALRLVTRLLDGGHTVLIETSGAVSTEGVDARARVILDVKTPGSGEHARNVWKNLARLKPGHDELKLVITSDDDYAWAKQVLADHPVPAGVAVLFSPAAPLMEPARLAERIVADRLPVRFQLQLHKVLWGNRQGV
jgi:7-carboxy-7-deazaguanine synthase